MNKYIITILIFVILMIIQRFCCKFFTVTKEHLKNKKVEDQINFNKKNKVLLENIFLNELDNRSEKLKTMSYNDWIIYNKNKPNIEVENRKYYIFIYELTIPDRDFEKSTFVNRLHVNKDFINFSWNDIIKSTRDSLIFSRHTADENMLANAYQLGKNNIKNNILNYYWYDYLSNLTTKKISYIKTWSKDNISGIMGVGYNYEIVGKSESFKFDKYVNKPVLALTNISMLIISILMIYLYKDFKKSIIFLTLTNIYITYFLNTPEEIGSPNTELDKIKNINDGILSISFLAGVSIYILTNLHKNQNYKLFTESAIIFSFSIIFLLVTTYKITNYTTIEDIIKIRITNQMQFNLAVLLNIFIIINYLLHIVKFKDIKPSKHT